MALSAALSFFTAEEVVEVEVEEEEEEEVKGVWSERQRVERVRLRTCAVGRGG